MSIHPSEFLRAFFGAYSEAPVFLVSLPNQDERGRQASPKEVLTRDPATIDGFVRRWDQKGRGLYFCVNTILENAKPRDEGKSRRIKENIAEIVTAHTEVDAKSIMVPLDDVIAAIQNLPHPPSVVVRSGNGLHLYWLLSEGIAADPESIARVEALNAQLGDLVGGDPVHDVTRLLRVPGTHNSKGGAWTEVEVVEARYEPRHEIGDLEEMVAMLSPIVKRKPVERAPGVPAADNPFLRIAAQYGFKPPVDVEQRLAVMSLGGPGDSSIHSTQLAVSASLMNRGTPIDDIVDMLITATKAAVGPDGARWNWDREDRAIRQMCTDWQRKNPDHKVRALPRASVGDAVLSAPNATSDEAHEEQAAPAADGTNVVSFAAKNGPQKKRGRPPGSGAPKAGEIAGMVADGVIEAMQQSGRDLVHCGGESFFYRDGVWTLVGPAEQQILKALIQDGMRALGQRGEMKIANAAWKDLMETEPRDVIPWNAGTHVALGNGLLDLKTRAFGPWRSDAWCRMKVETPYDPAATCPIFLRFLESALTGREDPERQRVIAVIQEYFGSMLAVATLEREQRKALFVFGPSRAGKTVLSQIARLLIGKRIAAPSIEDIGNDFGLMTIAQSCGWIRDDAVSEGDRIQTDRFKCLVTGEVLDINRKNLTPVAYSCEVPILLTANSLPRAKDNSDAIYNRSIVLEMNAVVEEKDALAAKLALGIPEDAGVAAYIAKHEASGILNWALAGLDRLRVRGRFDLPESMQASVERFRDLNNPIAQWASACIELDAEYKVARADLLCSFHGWSAEEHGDGARAFGGGYVKRAMESLFKHRGVDFSDNNKDGAGNRFVHGLRLNQEGRRLFDYHLVNPLKNGSKGLAKDGSEVNRAMPSGGSAGRALF